MALDRKRRVVQSDFLKLARAEYDRLIEAGPLIDDGVIKQFNNKFKNYQVAMPSICNGLDRCIIYKVKKESNKNTNENYEDNNDNDNDTSNKKKLENKENKEDYTNGVEDIIEEQEKLIPNKELEIKIDDQNNLNIENTDNNLNIEDTDNNTHTCDKCDKVESLSGD